MLKPFTLALSLGLALALAGVSQAGGLLHGGAMASGQAPMVSPQGVVPTEQCAPTCAPKSSCFHMPHLGLHEKMQGLGCCLSNAGNKMSCGFADMCKKLKPKPACYTYEWVLKKKKVHGGCGQPGCSTCGGGGAPIYPTSQVAPAPQGPFVSPAPQMGGSPQASYGYGPVPTTASLGGISPAPVPVSGDEAPPAPEVPHGPTSSLLFSTPSGN